MDVLDTDVITYTSSNESIVTVDQNGVMTAQGTGNAFITVKVNEGYFGRVKVTVHENVTAIQLNAEEADIYQGETFQLKLSYVPESADISEEPVFTSSNERVATVDKNGLVTSVSEGTAVITVKFTAKKVNLDGAESTAELSQKCVIHVVSKDVKKTHVVRVPDQAVVLLNEFDTLDTAHEEALLGDWKLKNTDRSIKPGKNIYTIVYSQKGYEDQEAEFVIYAVRVTGISMAESVQTTAGEKGKLRLQAELVLDSGDDTTDEADVIKEMLPAP